MLAALAQRSQGVHPSRRTVFWSRTRSRKSEPVETSANKAPICSTKNPLKYAKKEKLIYLVNLARPLVIKLLRELSSISSTGKIREPGWPAEA
jgi:hypothetical protein